MGGVDVTPAPIVVSCILRHPTPPGTIMMKYLLTKILLKLKHQTLMTMFSTLAFSTSQVLPRKFKPTLYTMNYGHVRRVLKTASLPTYVSHPCHAMPGPGGMARQRPLDGSWKADSGGSISGST